MNEENLKVLKQAATSIMRIAEVATSCMESVSQLKEDMLNNQGTLTGYINRLDNINKELDKIAVNQEAMDSYKDIMSY